MNPTKKLCLALAFGFACATAVAGGKTFEANFASATKNSATPKGAAYDNSLGVVMQTVPEFRSRFKQCVTRYPGTHAVRGYFDFSAAGKYRVFLEPKNAFSSCLSRALEGHRVPAPPSVPYLNPFKLSTNGK